MKKNSRKTSSKPVRQLILNDLHIPYQDNQALECAVSVGKSIGVTRIDILGDLNDFASVSLKFKDVPRDLRNTRIKFELGIAKDFLRRLRGAFPVADIHVHSGNHDTRLERYIREKLPQLYGVDALTYPALLGLADLGITHHDYGDLVRCGGLCLTHGDVVRKESGQSAKAMLDRYGVDVICGHTHRGGVYHKTVNGKTLTSWENYCVCNPQQAYLIGPANWQQGFAVVAHNNDGGFAVTQFRVAHGRYLQPSTGEWVKPDSRCFRGLRSSRP